MSFLKNTVFLLNGGQSKMDSEQFKKIAESKKEYHSAQRKLSFEEKINLMCDIQEKQYFMNHTKVKVLPWRIKEK